MGIQSAFNQALASALGVMGTAKILKNTDPTKTAEAVVSKQEEYKKKAQEEIKQEKIVQDENAKQALRDVGNRQTKDEVPDKLLDIKERLKTDPLSVSEEEKTIYQQYGNDRVNVIDQYLEVNPDKLRASEIFDRKVKNQASRQIINALAYQHEQAFEQQARDQEENMKIRKTLLKGIVDAKREKEILGGSK